MVRGSSDGVKGGGTGLLNGFSAFQRRRIGRGLDNPLSGLTLNWVDWFPMVRSSQALSDLKRAC